MLDPVAAVDQAVLREVARQCAVAEERAIRAGAAIDDRWRKVCRLPVLAASLPGFSELWSREVPEEHLERLGGTVRLSCSCGAPSVGLDVGSVHMCPDDCGLWVLRTEEAVLFKKWPRDDAAAVAA